MENKLFRIENNILIEYYPQDTNKFWLNIKKHIVKIPDNVIEIADRAFEKCMDIKAVIIPKSVKRIGAYAFYDSHIETLIIEDGVEVIEKIRSWSNMPIIVISARSEDTDIIDALDAGADDYLTKPFSVEELLARLRVTQRRLNMIQNETAAEASVFTNGKLRIDYAAGCAYLDDEELHLTPIEYKLLCLLSRNVGKVLTHTFITQSIWGSSWNNDIASLRVFMATLRKKLENNADSPQYIQTHIGVGYRMMKVE